jgi:hypothetical protein
MLASTVQFSSNGRAQVIPHVLRGCGLVRLKSVAEATDPSGPNSVLWAVTPWIEVPLRRRTDESTDKPGGFRLNGQCSTSVPAPVIDVCDETRSWTG